MDTNVIFENTPPSFFRQTSAEASTEHPQQLEYRMWLHVEWIFLDCSVNWLHLPDPSYTDAAMICNINFGTKERG
jgi:hypothetical protein